MSKEVVSLEQPAIRPSLEVERNEIEPVILLADRVRSVASGLTSAGSTSYLEAYQLGAYALGLPWKEVVVKNVEGYLRVDALIGDQEVRVAAKSDEIFFIFPVVAGFGNPLCAEYELQIRFSHFGLDERKGFKELWVSLYYSAPMTEEALEVLENQKNMGVFPGYELSVRSTDKYFKKDHPELIDHSSQAVWGLFLDSNGFNTVEQIDFAREGGVIERGLVNEVHERLKSLIISVKKSEWPTDDQCVPPKEIY